MAIRQMLWWPSRSLVQRQRELEALVEQRTRELESSRVELAAVRKSLNVGQLRDDLTQLWSRGAILDILRRELERAMRTGAPVAAVLVDLDDFSRISQVLGHATGDRILCDIALRLTTCLRPYDAVGRYGEKAFLIVMHNLPVRDPGSRIEKLRQTINDQPFSAAVGVPPAVTASIGVAWPPTDATQAEALLTAANAALLRAKKEGKNRVCFAEPADFPEECREA
jgi:diguanylate cyclase (GGDEF)-like protein